MPLICRRRHCAFRAAFAEEYLIDTQAPTLFAVQDLSPGLWLVIGRFNDFGEFSVITESAASKVSVTINTASVDSNHAEHATNICVSGFSGGKRFPVQPPSTSTSFRGKQGNGRRC